MKKLFSMLGALMLSFTSHAATINKIDPPYWYAGLQHHELQLMVYGQDIGFSQVSTDYPGVIITNTVTLESHNYLLVYLDIKDAKPGKIQLTFTKEKQQIKQEYELKARSKKGEEHIGFDSSDVLYLLMPDRFANGDESIDNIKGMSDYKVDRSNPSGRHGGDMKGIEQHLDYFTELGVTALWFTPVLENNMRGGSYHGYATTDYYKVDPRFGTNEEYRQLIAKAHQKGLKVVMDMIFNHCGSEHIWLKDMPSRDWFNHSDYQDNYVQTNYRLTPVVDPYASKHDYDRMANGWFVRTMPDLNQNNPHVMTYLLQTSIWWVEYADIDGIRMDTYPYADYQAMSQWMNIINKEYPHFNVVGESWVTEPAFTAWFQKDSKLAKPLNSNLTTVMDFSFFDKVNIAKKEQSDGQGRGLDRIYNNFVYDFLYPNPLSVLTFIENHDTDRYLEEGQDFASLKQAVTMLLTVPRIPQLYYGTEVLLNGVKNITDGYVRKDFPGGWKGDKQNAFTAEGRTVAQNECFNFYKTILHWRKGNEVISQGSMTHFIVENSVYAYARQLNDKTVFVMLNGSDKEITADLSIYKEIIQDYTSGKDVLTGKTIQLGKELKMQPRETLLLEL